MAKLTIAIIPARKGSKRLQNKNNKLLGRIPLIIHSILFAKENLDVIDVIYVSSNDDAIKKIASEYGVKVIERPDFLCGDDEPTVSALKHVLESIYEEVENVILLQPTSPLRPVNLLKEAFEVFQKNNCNSLFTVSRNHQKLGKISKNQFLPVNYKLGQRSQDMESLYFENGLLYITKSSLIRANKIISENAYPLVIDHPFAEIDIDTQKDLEYAEYLFKKHTPGPS
jgi:N-acylneuraminate cytidylyltransferase